MSWGIFPESFSRWFPLRLRGFGCEALPRYSRQNISPLLQIGEFSLILGLQRIRKANQ